MPHIFDNIENKLLDELKSSLEISHRADICVGYFNLRGWISIADAVDRFDGSQGHCCRLLVGMNRHPEDEMRNTQSAIRRSETIGGDERARMVQAAVESFKEQIEFGVPSVQAEQTLRRLAGQIRAKKVQIKIYLGENLHAKLYLFETSSHHVPLVGYLGSSNLTFNGLAKQGELNIDVLDPDNAQKLQAWFADRWNERIAIDISDKLAELIETSWVREELVSPFSVYLKIAYYLCEDARRGEREFQLPRAFRGVMLDFQSAAVSLAAHHLHQRGGVLLGDVVGLGKTLMATAIARIFQEDEGSSALIICPPKLEEMWQSYKARYNLAAEVMSLGKVIDILPTLETRYRLVIIDESHNLRNRESKRYRAIRDYIQANDPKVLLLTATPYNKQFEDLSNQLRFIVDEDQDLRVRPERFFQAWTREGKTEQDFTAEKQILPHTLRAFEQSDYYEDWRDLMRMFLVRRTRNFIIRNYAHFDQERRRYYVTINNQPSYFPKREPHTVRFGLDENDPNDQYARLFSEQVVDTIEQLALPRYGLANYLDNQKVRRATAAEKRLLENLNRAGRRLIGFSRTNLFKRLESSGFSFLVSLERHVLRNYITLYALENNLPVPIGTQDAGLLDPQVNDADNENIDDEDNNRPLEDALDPDRYQPEMSEATYRQRAKLTYQAYRDQFSNRFKWLDSKFFIEGLKRDLQADARKLIDILCNAGAWQVERDAKLNELTALIQTQHLDEKLLIFTQFADTAEYLNDQLQRRGVGNLGLATADSDTTTLVRCFSPSTSGGLRSNDNELRVLVATDVLAEGQNLQDSHIIVNYDLPCAIIRLIQRAGRVDRIGQRSETIRVYSFLPAEGVEQIIRLRERLSRRLQENQEVIGSDESFFGEDAANQLRDLYTENSNILEDDRDDDVDLSSLAMQVWNSASEADQQAALRLPPLVAASRPNTALTGQECGEPGVIAYLRFPEGADALVRVNEQGELVSQSLTSVFRDAACGPDAPALQKAENHHELVAAAAGYAIQEQTNLRGGVGTMRSTRRKVIERLKRYRETVQARYPLFAQQMLDPLDPDYDAIFTHTLTANASTTLGRQIRLGMTDEQLVEMVVQLHTDGKLCVSEEIQQTDPVVVCSLGLRECEG